MGLLDSLRGQFIEVIEWTDTSSDTMVYRFPVRGNEIKMGARLIVREGQAVVFIDQGKLADVFAPGSYILETENLPILTKLQSWPYGFNSPFKAEVYFVSTRQFVNQKWGTPNPVMLRDPEFGPIRLRAFGAFSMRVADPAVFMRELVGTDGHFTTDRIHGQLKKLVVAGFSDLVAESGIPALDLAGKYDELSRLAQEKLNASFAEYGLTLTQFTVENISLPKEVEQALDERTKMGVLGDLGRYTQFKAAEALGDAARNQGGMAGAGVGMGAGMAMGNVMANAMTGGAAGNAAQPTATPAGAKFCSQCGARLGTGGKFCSECGAPLAPG